MENNNHSTFDGLTIAPQILEVLDKIKFTTPTPIQYKAIPAGIEGKDLVGIAQTGTGKTLAFVIPIIQHMFNTTGKALVLVPTHELAHQVDEQFRRIGAAFHIRTVIIIGGGSSMNEQIKGLRKNPDVIIATPGRLIDHMGQKTLTLSDVNTLVLDEADRMLDMGFLPQIDRILKAIPKDRQTMLFSATMPQEVAKIAASHMKLPLNVEIAPSGTVAEKVTQELFIVKRESKIQLLRKLLEQYRGSVLIFTRTKIGARKTARDIKQMGFPAMDIHSDRSMAQRKDALAGFKSGKYRILVATDIAARGIDVTGIEVVLNFDLPEDAENYVHRIGRTGRAGHVGHAISFATPEQKSDVQKIERLIKTAMPVSEHPELPVEKFFSVGKRTFAPRGGRFGRRRSGFRR